MIKAGIVGCGNISRTYLGNKDMFPNLKIVKCADINQEAAAKAAEKYGIEACSVEELLADPEIDIILNLTTPGAHAEVAVAALNAGKHIYTEKPLAVNMEEADKIMALAAEKNLRVGCAPDTFLGGGQQTCRSIIDSGIVGKISGGTALMLSAGHECWHPAPAFYYKKGAGPLFDMGPYYITSLVNLLGPVKCVSALSNRSTDCRIGTMVNHGKKFNVEVDTHVNALLHFECGAIINLVMSFDVSVKSPDMSCIELWGAQGGLRVPDPNTFGGEVKFGKAGLTMGWANAANTYIYNDNTRIIGLADMALAIEENRPHRASGELAYHVLDVMCSIIRSAENREYVEIKSTCSRPAPLAKGLHSGEIR